MGSDGRVFVVIVDLVGVASDGEDDREAIKDGIDAPGSDLDPPVPPRGDPGALRPQSAGIDSCLWVAPKLALYAAMREERVSNSK